MGWGEVHRPQLTTGDIERIDEALSAGGFKAGSIAERVANAVGTLVAAKVANEGLAHDLAVERSYREQLERDLAVMSAGQRVER
jgi:hypothetical protein